MIDRLWIAPSGLHVEPARVEDAPVLARLHAQGFYRGWPREEFAAFLAAPAVTPGYVVCDAKRSISGFALFRIAADEAELLTIAIDPRRRGKGLGRALLAAALSDLTLSPVRRVFLEVDAQNGAAIQLYERSSFERVGERSGYYPRPDGSAATALVMCKQLG